MARLNNSLTKWFENTINLRCAAIPSTYLPRSIGGSFEDAGNRGFRYLFAYISGENQVTQKISMTAPVVQDLSSELLEMTAPVLQQEFATQDDIQRTSEFRIAFVLPEGFTLQHAPSPTNPNVHLRPVPASLVAVIRFSGGWSTRNFQQHLQMLRIALKETGLISLGTPRLARYDPPFKPWFMRHNEILLDPEEPSPSGKD
ncbi:heme-binding protein [Arthrobacter glacialis]|uniref:SOUL family heme-binding protein n=1 Tax=Arthrobacter glacialis TaxID=1664 RepID=UPI00311AB491